MSGHYWIAYGSVRGGCGHRHRTRDTAQRCADNDQRAIRRAYPSTFPTCAYSDRSVHSGDCGAPSGYRCGCS